MVSAQGLSGAHSSRTPHRSGEEFSLHGAFLMTSLSGVVFYCRQPLVLLFPEHDSLPRMKLL